MKKTLLTIFLICFGFMLKAQTPVWSTDIAPILYQNCTKCHNSTGIAPFELLSYSDAFSHRTTMQFMVTNRFMPPWPPDENYRHLAHERVLSTADINKINDWVNAGAPSGDTTLAPQQPVYNGQAEIANPTLSLQIPTYTVNATTDLYRCFVLPVGNSQQQFITELEALPGDRSIVHHILIFEDTSSIPLQLDAADPDFGYTNFGGTGSSSSNLIGVWAPGSTSFKLPAGMGINLQANTNIIVQIHYPAGTLNKVDSTQFNFKLSPGPLRTVWISSPLNHFFLDNGPLYIPANQLRTFNAHYDIPINITLLAVAPHMHLIGRTIKSFAVSPQNDTTPLVNVPDWNFRWQGMYQFQQLLKIDAQSTLYSTTDYDNTTNNPYNPNAIPQDVFLGEATTDEMMLVYFAYTIYFPGDENIVQDSAIFAGVNDLNYSNVEAPVLYNAVPNPANDIVSVNYLLPRNEKVSFEVYDLKGRLVMQPELNSEPNIGLNMIRFSVRDLAAGSYYVVMKSKTNLQTCKLIRME